MTKFKVGDRVTLNAKIIETDKKNGLVKIELGDGVEYYYPIWIPEADITRNDTTFRDQAAIAALQAMLINTDVSPGGDARAMAKSSFELAEALDAERKKRDGGEG